MSNKTTQDPTPKTTPETTEDEKKFTNLSGLEINRLYTPEDLKDIPFEKDIGEPGKFPFTRGIFPTMYRERLWTMRQFSGFGVAEDTNKRFKYLMEHGENGLSVAFDMPTLMGVDSDHESATGEVGVCGVAIDTLDDMERLFSGIPLDQVTVSMTINAPAAILLAMYVCVAEKQGVSPDKLGGTLQNDILKEYIAQKEWIYPPGASLRLIKDTIVYATEHMPRYHPISISGYHIREVGSTAVQELAYTLYNGLTYVNQVVMSGLDVDAFAPRLSFFFNSHNDFFEEIAKFRAARRMWAKEMRMLYMPKDPRSMALRFHTQTAGCTLTAQQPYNNITRVALQALAGVLGGTQSLHTDSMDETYALPTEEAVRIALRSQQTIAHESGVANTVDPLGGSYYVEALTKKMERAAYGIFMELDDKGGMVKAIEEGYPQGEIKKAAYEYQKQVDSKERIVVGVNDYVTEKNPKIETFKADPKVEKTQRERLDKIRAQRNDETLAQALTKLKEVCNSQFDNVMPAIIECVKAHGTVGEISDAMKEVFGEYTEPLA